MGDQQSKVDSSSEEDEPAQRRRNRPRRRNQSKGRNLQKSSPNPESQSFQNNPQHNNRRQIQNPASLPQSPYKHVQDHNRPGQYHENVRMNPGKPNFQHEIPITSKPSTQQINYKLPSQNPNSKQKFGGTSISSDFHSHGVQQRSECDSKLPDRSRNQTGAIPKKYPQGTAQGLKANKLGNRNLNNLQNPMNVKTDEAYQKPKVPAKQLKNKKSGGNSTGKVNQWNIHQESSKSGINKGKRNYHNRSKSRNRNNPEERVETPLNLMSFTRNQSELISKENNLMCEDTGYNEEGECNVSSKSSTIVNDEECASSVSSFSSNVHITAKGIIGVFWDIENCPVPKRRSAREIVKKIRETFYGQRKEDVFTVACDVTVLSPKVRKELNNAQIDLMHVDSTQKNAADYKLSDYLRRFVDVTKPEGSCVVLISGDIDFARELHNLRYRHQIYVVLIPNRQVKAELCDMANEVVPFHEFIENVTVPSFKGKDVLPQYIVIQNIPQKTCEKVFSFLKNLVRCWKAELKTNISNCCCIIRFSEKDEAEKAFVHLSSRKKALFESEEVIITQTNSKPKLEETKETERTNSESEVGLVIGNSKSEVLNMEFKGTISKTAGIPFIECANSAREICTVPVLPYKNPRKDANSEVKAFICLNNEESEMPTEHSLKDEGDASVVTPVILLLESEHAGDAEFWKGYLKNIIKDNSSLDTIVVNNQIHVYFPTLSSARKVKIQLEKETELKVLGIHIGSELTTNLESSVVKLIMECKTFLSQKCVELIREHSKKKLELETELAGLDQVLNSLPSYSSPIEYAKLRENLEAIEAKLTEWRNLETEFKLIVTQKMNELDQWSEVSIEEGSEKLAILKQGFSMECNLFSKALPIYAMRSKLVDLVQRNPVSILLAETGSGKSTQITQYVYQAGLAKDGLIVCTQPRELAVRNLSLYLSSETGYALGTLVGSKVGLQSRCSQNTKILFMTDQCLFNECLMDPILSKYTCVIVDDVQERCIYTDLLIGMLKNIIQQRPEFKILLSYAAMNPSSLQNYFNITDDAVLSIPGNVFPIEIIWNEKKVEVGYNYVDKAVLKAFDVHNSEDPGHVLVFLTTPSETLRACEALENLTKKQKLSKKVVCLPLHDWLDDEELNGMFSSVSEGTRKVFFSASSAETSLNVPDISYVIDTGMTKELQYDVKTQTNEQKVKFVNQSSANQRKIKARCTQVGKCFRLYSEENYNEMAENVEPEIIRVNLGQALLKLMQLGFNNPCDFNFLDPPTTIISAMRNLTTLGATVHNRLTELGLKMAKLSLEPALAKLIISGFEENVGYEAVVIASLALMSENDLFKFEENNIVADFQKAEFCKEEGDFHTFLEVYKRWLFVPKAQRLHWCTSNYINEKSVKITDNCVREILQICQQELGLVSSNVFSSQPGANEILQYLILEVFKQNLCIFSGLPQMGYFTAKNFDQVVLHPSSSLYYIGYITPMFLIYQSKLVTSKGYIMNITSVSNNCIEKAIKNGLLDSEAIDEMKKFILKPINFGPFGDGVMKIFCGVEEEISSQINDKYLWFEHDIQTGMIVVFCKEGFCSYVTEVVERKIEDIKLEIKNEDQVINFHGASDGILYLLSAGAAVTEVIMPGEFLRLSISNYENKSALLDICQKSKHLFSYKEVLKETKELAVSFKNVRAALEVSELLKSFGYLVRPEVTVLTSQQKEDLFPFRLDVSWLRRPCKGIAFLKFSSQKDFSMYSPQLMHSKNLFVNQKRFFVTLNINDPNELFIKNLDLQITQVALRNALRNIIGPGVKYDLRIIHKKGLETTDDDVKALKLQLADVFSQYAKEDDIIVVIDNPKPEFILWKAKVYFQNPQAGQKSFNALNGNVNFPGTPFPICMSVKMNCTLVCHIDVFEMVKESLEKTLEGFSNAVEKGDDLRIEAECSTKVSNFVVIRIHSNNVRDMQQALKKLQPILRGDQIHCLGKPLKENLFLEAAKIGLKTLGEAYGVKIFWDSSKMIVSIMHGDPNVIDLIKGDINDYLDQIYYRHSSKSISLIYPNKPKGLLKLLLRVCGHTFERLQIDCGLESTQLNIPEHSISISGSKESIQKAEEYIDELANQLSGDTSNNEGETCALCLCAIADDEDSYRLQYCGHIYCQDCIQAQMKFAIIPFACAAQDCQEPFVIEDLNYLLDHESRKLISAAALHHAVKVNGGMFKYCPTLQCTAVYKVPVDESSRSRFFCNICTNYICSRCDVIYHHGISCDMYQISEEDDFDCLVEMW